MRNRILSGILAGLVFLAALSMAGCGSNSSTTPYIPPSHPGEPKFNYPSSVVAINVSGTETDLYVADTTNHTIRKVVIDSSVSPAVVKVSTFAGKAGVIGKADDNDGDINTRLSRFHFPCSITTDGVYLYVADTYNNTIRKITISNGNVETLAGKADDLLVHYRDSTDDTGGTARFYRPFGITYDSVNQKLYVADTDNHVIRTVELVAGLTYSKVGTLAGTPRKPGYNNGAGATALFRSPIGIATDGTTVYVGDTGNNEIRTIDIASMVVGSLAGDHTVSPPGSADGTGVTALFYKPAGLAFFGGNLYVADSYNYTIRQVIVSSGNTSTLAGTVGVFYRTEAEATDPTKELFRFPQAIVTLDGTTFYVADTYGHILRELIPGTPNKLTILTGVPLVAGHEDSPP